MFPLVSAALSITYEFQSHLYLHFTYLRLASPLLRNLWVLERLLTYISDYTYILIQNSIPVLNKYSHTFRSHVCHFHFHCFLWLSIVALPVHPVLLSYVEIHTKSTQLQFSMATIACFATQCPRLHVHDCFYPELTLENPFFFTLKVHAASTISTVVSECHSEWGGYIFNLLRSLLNLLTFFAEKKYLHLT